MRPIYDNRSLSEEARRAKLLRRRLERRYRRTVLPSDNEAYVSACSAARDSILRSRADRIKSELDEVSGDVGATWRTTQRLFHSKHKTVYNDTECAKLVSTFCQFFAEKVNCIRDNISDALASSARRMFAVKESLCYSPGSADVSRYFINFGLDAISTRSEDAVTCSRTSREVGLLV